MIRFKLQIEAIKTALDERFQTKSVDKLMSHMDQGEICGHKSPLLAIVIFDIVILTTLFLLCL